ncbi:MAG: hypothetical protein EOR46_23475 [Mesorhizobium sp.]|nr:MAG: hypothetical protein EOR46_23475 [Mesorhizobium sp.]RWK67724.1 MAG: hypothetical protein EOR54_17975 [Mesorhizobium sp.]RWK79190.1 MAG: hypothetical protein EOR50_07340 [Mesorhizobium sp.]RWK84073.1 MAG: hypothetical protein EOR51_04230 [Mesorhizobium sp.]RWL05398.1 MAG: hypothetical protein EOR55_12400 [Mesorhizobium sp.]
MLKYNSWSTRLKALRCKLFGKTDFERWTDASEFEDWEERTKIIARIVPPGARVIEFGVGMGKLQRHLDPSCQYTPSPSPSPWGVRTSAAVREDCRGGIASTASTPICRSRSTVAGPRATDPDVHPGGFVLGCNMTMHSDLAARIGLGRAVPDPGTHVGTGEGHHSGRRE